MGKAKRKPARAELTPSELEAVKEGEAYRLSGQPGITLDEVEAALNRPETGDRGQGEGVVTSKSVARRLAATGGPPPACTCFMPATLNLAGGEVDPRVHDPACPKRAYLAALAKSPT